MNARTLAVVVLSLCACDDKTTSGAAPSRVVAVEARRDQANESEFCDVRFAADGAPEFALPPVEGVPAGPDQPGKAHGARWINVWATWCPPCIEELPLLRRLSGELAREGVSAPLVLLSIDGSADVVAAFQREHPEAAPSLRLSKPTALEPWLNTIGLDRGATLPVHVFLDARGRVACTRTGAIRESDIPSIRKLLAAR